MLSAEGKSSGIFRVKDWWWSKAALLMGMIYLFASRYNIGFEKFIPLSILSLITITGFAGTGYLFNDLFDIEQDQLAGKRNFLAGKPTGLVIFLFFISLAFVFLPWLFLPKSKFSFVLIAMQLVLFIVYSAPPIRLKERGLAGIITDALYAHGLPALLAMYTFALAANYPFTIKDVALLFIWQTVSGIRNIILHQHDDKEADRKSGSKNFVTDLNASQFRALLGGLIVAEWLLSMAFFVSILSANPLFAFCLLVILTLSALGFMLFMEKDAPAFLSSTWKFFPNSIYEKWLPVTYLGLLAVHDGRFLILFLLHLTVFNFNFYTDSVDRLYGRWKSIPFKGSIITLRIVLSYPGNYLIYYLFRIFGVDLKKENVSAREYLAKRKENNMGSKQ